MRVVANLHGREKFIAALRDKPRRPYDMRSAQDLCNFSSGWPPWIANVCCLSSLFTTDRAVRNWQGNVHNRQISGYNRQSNVHNRQNNVHNRQSKYLQPTENACNWQSNVHNRQSSAYNRQRKCLQPTEQYIQLTELMFNNRQNSTYNRQSSAYNRQSIYLQPTGYIFTTDKVMYIPTEQCTQATE